MMKIIPNIPLRATQAAIALMFALNAGPSGAMDLVAAYRQALQYDPTSLAADQALVAGGEKAVQGDSLLLPRINLQTTVSRIHDNTSSSDTSGALSSAFPSSSTGTSRQAEVQLVQPLYDASASASKRQMHLQSEQAQTQFTQSRDDLIVRVAEAYFGVIVAEENFRVVTTEKDAIRHQRDRAKARFDIGQGKITDVHEAQARLDAVETSEVSVQSTLELRRAQFQETIGVAPDHLAGLAQKFVPRQPEPDNLVAWQMKGQDLNPTVKIKKSDLEIAIAEIKKHSIEGRPTLNLVGSYAAKGQSGNLSPLVAPDGNRTASIGVQLKIPLYSGGQLSSREREAVAKQLQSEQELAAARRDVRLKVQDSYLTVKTGVSRIIAGEQALISARTALEATTLGRDVGTRTELDVLDAQHRAYSAELDLIQSRIDYLLGRLRLEAAAGEVSEDSLRSLGIWLAS